jgi:hypothetical protein
MYGGRPSAVTLLPLPVKPDTRIVQHSKKDATERGVLTLDTSNVKQAQRAKRLFIATHRHELHCSDSATTDILRLTTGIRSEKCVVRRFRRCTNVIERTYANLDSTDILLHTLAIWYSLLFLGYKPVQHVTVLNTVGNCNTMVRIVILTYLLHGAESFLRS